MEYELPLKGTLEWWGYCDISDPQNGPCWVVLPLEPDTVLDLLGVLLLFVFVSLSLFAKLNVPRLDDIVAKEEEPELDKREEEKESPE